MCTQRALYFLKTIKNDDERTYLNIITINVFNYDKGGLDGNNVQFTWAVLRFILGKEHPTTVIEETAIKKLMEEYTVSFL